MLLLSAAIAALPLACGKGKNADLELAAAEKALADAQNSHANDCAGETFRAAESVLAEAKQLATKGDIEAARQKAGEAERLANQAKDASPEGCNKKDEPAPAAATATNEAGRGADLSSIEQTIYFDFNEASIREDSKQILTRIASMMGKDSGIRIEVEGHCDERGSTEYNLHLGERRAQAVEKYLVTQGVKTSQVEVISYGEERPLDVNSSEAAWAKNRRAEIKKR
ncbi:MAG: peptidoglycan-associated lipoprotein Pal [Deltaproteobacteria bacterium]|nr:peptidoglycan-associated lipoprotein Pal [Deltaproteobacteria bacterium]